MLGMFLTMLVGAFIDGAAGETSGGGLVMSVIGLAHVIPAWAVTVRRLHDTDRSGWWALLSLVPLVGTVILLIFCCAPSQPGRNRFGEPITSASTSPAFRGDTYQQADLSAFRPAPALHRQPAALPDAPNAPAPTANAPGIDEGALIERLERLAALRAVGAIDEAEFATMKANLLARVAN
jgi:hypothetical protein